MPCAWRLLTEREYKALLQWRHVSTRQLTITATRAVFRNNDLVLMLFPFSPWMRGNYGFTQFAPPRMSQRANLRLFAQNWSASSALCQPLQSFDSSLPPTRRSSAAPSSSPVLASVIFIPTVISPTPDCLRSHYDMTSMWIVMICLLFLSGSCQ